MQQGTTCRANKRNGQRCGSRVLLPSGFCYLHDPTKRAETQAARVKGGQAKATTARLDKLVPSHMRPVLGAVLSAIRDVRDKTMTPAQGTAIASLASAAVRVYQSGIIEERIAELEEVAQRARA